ncbi:glycoside hydrolase family 16 protein [Filimonas effusa]|uniref:Glycoside hydrolase family 16 protein n=1 Tax=Filimonas effusa TaxID=2508721 RepID=A0A4V1MAM3_9BACT|nr:glycoside hydrolase family 16 protein [Filimonas effusa]RXK86376.1 glycoside hydrolase family 16 protein [Filimonas effusa]
MKILTFGMIVLITTQLLACAGQRKGKPVDASGALQVSQDKGWAFETKPVWADEFDKAGKPDSTKWGYDLGGNGWGNNELQYYTDKAANASVANGILTITVKKEAIEGKEYTSARLVSKGKGDFLYGRIEVKAKLPIGKGTWPAIWMLPTDRAYGGWPKSGEIDIMEHVGYAPNKVHISIHSEAYNHVINTQKTATKMVDNAMTAFHVYRVDWTPYAIRGYIDNALVFTFVNEGKGAAAWPFDKRFHLLLNVAYGGNWGGEQGIDPSILPAKMEIDYVRVFKMVEK